MVKVGDKLEVVTDQYQTPRGTILTVTKVYPSTSNHFDTDDPTGKKSELMFWGHALTGGYLKPLSTGPLPFRKLTEAELRQPTWDIKDLKSLPIVNLDPVCECGADKHGFASHSGWCPKA